VRHGRTGPAAMLIESAPCLETLNTVWAKTSTPQQMVKTDMPVSYRLSFDRLSYEIVWNSQPIGNARRDQMTRRTFEFMPNDHGKSFGLKPSVHSRMRDSPAGYGLLSEIGAQLGQEASKPQEPWRYDPDWAKNLPPRPKELWSTPRCLPNRPKLGGYKEVPHSDGNNPISLRLCSSKSQSRQMAAGSNCGGHPPDWFHVDNGALRLHKVVTFTGRVAQMAGISN
jgi:hypothetical protein